MCTRAYHRHRFDRGYSDIVHVVLGIRRAGKYSIDSINGRSGDCRIQQNSVQNLKKSLLIDGSASLYSRYHVHTDSMPASICLVTKVGYIQKQQ